MGIIAESLNKILEVFAIKSVVLSFSTLVLICWLVLHNLTLINEGEYRLVIVFVAFILVSTFVVRYYARTDLLLASYITFTLISSVGGMNYVATIAGGALLSLFALSALTGRERINLYGKSYYSFFLYLFFFWAIVSFLVNSVSAENLSRVFTLSQYFVLLILVISIVNSIHKFILIYAALVASVGIMSTLMLLEYFNIIESFLSYEKAGRISLSGQSINTFAFYNVGAFIISWGMLSICRKKIHRYLLIFFSSIFIISILASASLTAIIALTSWFVVNYLGFLGIKSLKKILSLVAALFFLYLIIANYELLLTDVLATRILGSVQGLSQVSVEADLLRLGSSRGSIWLGGISLVSDNPIFGAGLVDYQKHILDYIPYNYSYYRGWSSRDAHNTFLGIMASMGIPAFIFFLLFTIDLSIKLYKKSTSQGLLVNRLLFTQFNLLFTSLVFGLGNVILWDKLFWIVIGLSIAILNINKREASVFPCLGLPKKCTTLSNNG